MIPIKRRVFRRRGDQRVATRRDICSHCLGTVREAENSPTAIVEVRKEIAAFGKGRKV